MTRIIANQTRPTKLKFFGLTSFGLWAAKFDQSAQFSSFDKYAKFTLRANFAYFAYFAKNAKNAQRANFAKLANFHGLSHLKALVMALEPQNA
jgi:hypothetical protein